MQQPVYYLDKYYRCFYLVAVDVSLGALPLVKKIGEGQAEEEGVIHQEVYDPVPFAAGSFGAKAAA